jgi:hypothetical protein
VRRHMRSGPTLGVAAALMVASILAFAGQNAAMASGISVDQGTRVGLATFNGNIYDCYEVSDTVYVSNGSSATSVGESTSGCSLASWNGNLYVAWTDISGALELAASPTGLSFNAPLVLPQYSDQAPAIYQNGAGTSLDIAWRGLDTSHHLNVGVSNSNATAFTYYELSYTTSASPSITAFMGHLYLAWTSTGSSPTINVLQFTAVPTVNCTQTFTQTAAYGPTVGWNVANSYLFLAWVGTDPDHTLNAVAAPDNAQGCKNALPNESAPTAFTGFTGALGRDGDTGGVEVNFLGANPYLEAIELTPKGA